MNDSLEIEKQSNSRFTRPLFPLFWILAMATLTHRALSYRRHPTLDPWFPIRQWINQLEVSSDRIAHLICRLIPCTCPFERTFTLFGQSIHIPPLCKLNPLYNELVFLRFRALSYLSDICGEDITPYIC